MKIILVTYFISYILIPLSKSSVSIMISAYIYVSTTNNKGLLDQFIDYFNAEIYMKTINCKKTSKIVCKYRLE